MTVQVQDAAKLVRIAPGQKDLKDAAPIQLADVQPGDRVLVRGKLADDGKSVVAAWVISMKKEDIAEKQARAKKRVSPSVFRKTPSCADMLPIP